MANRLTMNDVEIANILLKISEHQARLVDPTYAKEMRDILLTLPEEVRVKQEAAQKQSDGPLSSLFQWISDFFKAIFGAFKDKDSEYSEIDKNDAQQKPEVADDKARAENFIKTVDNPKLGALEPPWCEACSAPAYPLFLCDDRVHFLCKLCAAPCPACGKSICRACQPRCKCGGGNAVA